MRSGLALQTLGELRVTLAGEQVGSFRSRTALALLVYLAVDRRPRSRESLADVFWPDRAHAASQASLRMTLHRLKVRVGPYLTIRRGSVGLAPEADVAVDSTDFERLLRAGRDREAMELYKGPFLETFTLDGTRPFDAWVEAERGRLHDLATTAIQACLAERVAQGDLSDGIAVARRLLALEPWHEPTHRVLVRLLAQDGRRSAAMSHIAAYERTLREEVGLPPERATLDLFDAVRRGAIETMDLTPTRMMTAPDAVPHVAAHPAPLIGRVAELAALSNLLRNPDCRLVTVCGPGGIGKTRLAMQAALDVTHAFPDGTFLVPLADVSSPEAILPIMVQHLRPTLPDTGDMLRQLQGYLRHKRLLLVIDSFEHLVESGPVLLELLREAPALKLLVTSRERLSLGEEWLMPLEGLGRDEDAVALLTERAARLAPGSLEGAEATLREICRLVDRFPLAIEIVASWAGIRGWDEIAAAIRGDLDVLSTHRRDLPERHRSVRATLDGSWTLLTTQEQDALMRLPLFCGGFTAAEAESVAGATTTVLRSLVEKSLVRADGAGRFDLHELIRQYASAHLMRRGLVEAVAHRHFEAYLAVATEAEARLLTADQPAWLSRLDAEWSNFRAALTWGFANERPTADLVRMVSALAAFWRWRAAPEARRWLDRTLVLPGLETRDRAEIAYHVGHATWVQGNSAGAETTLSESLAHWAEVLPDDAPEVARTRCSLAMALYMQRDLAAARRHLEAAIDVFRREDARWWMAFALGWLGKVLTALGEPSQAAIALERCLDIYKGLENPWGVGLFSGSSAQLHLVAGDLAAARAMAEVSRDLLTEIGHGPGLAEAYRLLGAVARAEGRDAEARTQLMRSRALYEETAPGIYAALIDGELAELRDTSVPDSAAGDPTMRARVNRRGR